MLRRTVIHSRYTVFVCSITGTTRRGGGSFGGSRRIQFTHKYEDIISFENLLGAWREFLKGKRQKKDVQNFQYRLFDNIRTLHGELVAKTYVHGGYHAFNISDPKPRNIHKATVRDRLLHHAIYRRLYPFFNRTFINDSYSCRSNKGTHRAMNQFRSFGRKASSNNTRTAWVLKCDVRKFFASIDQTVLMNIVARYLSDPDITWLIERVVASFHSTAPGKGLPLGNLTSQLLVNVYMNEFDQFSKHTLKARHYVRYADDFVIISRDRAWLESLIPRIASFLNERLKLQLHPDKVFIKTLGSGVDFLGWVHFPDHRVLRTVAKRKMLKRLKRKAAAESVESYRGMLIHGNTQKLQDKVELLTR